MTAFPSLVSAEWLVDHLNHPNLVIVDCRFQLSDPQWGYQQYLGGHIPKAVYLHLDDDLSSQVAKHGGRHPLPTLDQLTKTFSRIGITDDTFVVAYDSSRFAFAARLWWLLRYLGHDRVALLDGGWSAWHKEGHRISSSVPTPDPQPFTPRPRLNWVVDRETVKIRKDLSSVVLIDARDSDRYLGKHEPIDPIAGSIEGAINFPWKQISTDQGYFKPMKFQQELWQDYENAEEIIVYCGSGVTACVNLFSLEMSGLKQTKLYVGGWSDWCSYLV